MLYFSKLRIISIFLVSLFFIFITSSNFFESKFKYFSKKINLGLDLQGGSYLLLEIDNTPVIEQKLQNLTSIIKSYLKDRVGSNSSLVRICISCCFRSDLINSLIFSDRSLLFDQTLKSFAIPI